MVVFNLPKSSATLPKEQLKEDCITIKNLISTRIKLDPKDVINIYRIGNKAPDKTIPFPIQNETKQIQSGLNKFKVRLSKFKVRLSKFKVRLRKFKVRLCKFKVRLSKFKVD